MADDGGGGGDELISKTKHTDADKEKMVEELEIKVRRFIADVRKRASDQYYTQTKGDLERFLMALVEHKLGKTARIINDLLFPNLVNTCKDCLRHNGKLFIAGYNRHNTNMPSGYDRYNNNMPSVSAWTSLSEQSNLKQKNIDEFNVALREYATKLKLYFMRGNLRTLPADMFGNIMGFDKHIINFNIQDEDPVNIRKAKLFFFDREELFQKYIEQESSATGVDFSFYTGLTPPRLRL